VRADALAAARGQARCGRCQTAFDALAGLSDTVPTRTGGIYRPSAATGPVELHQPVAVAALSQDDLFTAPGSDPVTLGSPLLSDSVHLSGPARAPSFAGWGEDSRPSRWWYAGAALMALALGAQLVWQFRAPLLANERARALWSAAAQRFELPLPTVDDRSRLLLATRDVRIHPSLDHALMIHATLVNEAPLPQHLPVLELVLTDANQQRVAMRRFEPRDYLLDPATDPVLPPGASVEVSLEVEDPGVATVGFHFALL